MLALVAVGFGLIFNVLKVFHIAHGAVYISGGYFFLWINLFSQQNLIISLILTVVFVILLGIIIEKLVYKPLANRNSGQAITLISSMGLYILLINFIAMLFGNESRIVESSFASGYDFNNIIITPFQLVQFIVSLVVLIIFFGFSKSNYFLKVRAVISNQQVASVLGINSHYIRFFAIATGSILAVISCILRFYDIGIDPHAGMSIMLSAAVVVIITGSFSLAGTVMVAILLSLLQTIAEWFLSAQWKEGVTFAVLIIILLWKTEGIVSYKMRIEEN